MLNKVVLIGRLTRDPELKYLTNGTSVATFTLAVDRNYANQQGEREADFIPIVVWRVLAENCAKYLAKGRLAAVAGRIQTRHYDTPDGQRRYITEIVADEVRFLEWGGSSAGNTNINAPKDIDNFGGGFNPIDGDEDELPF